MVGVHHRLGMAYQHFGWLEHCKTNQYLCSENIFQSRVTNFTLTLLNVLVYELLVAMN